jgi:hypothetical protein
MGIIHLMHDIILVVAQRLDTQQAVYMTQEAMFIMLVATITPAHGS